MINFTKMHGLGNDYVYIYCTKDTLKLKNITKFARFVSDRHFGIGSDGLILIYNSDIADFKMRMFNSDGTEAEMCGNGIRCVGKFVYDHSLTTKENITIETLAGIKKLQLHIKNNKVTEVTVDMGEPILEYEKIPVISNSKNIEITVENRKFTLNCVSMGNPHAVTQVDNLENFDIQKYGAILENNEHFPQKANIEFIKVIDEGNIKVRVWERGAGETMACGTGACAVAVAAYLKGLTNEKVNVQLLGGTLQIEWNKENNHIYMTGPAETVFEGVIEYDKD